MNPNESYHVDIDRFELKKVFTTLKYAYKIKKSQTYIAQLYLISDVGCIKNLPSKHNVLVVSHEIIRPNKPPQQGSMIGSDTIYNNPHLAM